MKKAVPFDLVMDLKSINQVEKFHYLPRENAGNGTLLKGIVYCSMDKENWTEAGTFDWKRDNEVKVFTFAEAPTARYIRMSITEAVGNYGSGQEIYVFRVPETESYLPGDINNDKWVDENDLTSYINYTGLRRGDADFEGYISNGDLNRNGLIDAYDISVVATQLDGGADAVRGEKVEGKLDISTPKQTYAKDELVEVLVKARRCLARSSARRPAFQTPHPAQSKGRSYPPCAPATCPPPPSRGYRTAAGSPPPPAQCRGWWSGIHGSGARR